MVMKQFLSVINMSNRAVSLIQEYLRKRWLSSLRLLRRENLSRARQLKKSTIDFIVDDKKEPTRLGKVQEILERASAAKEDFNVDSINKSIDTANDNLNSFKQPAIHSDFDDFSAKKEKNEVRIAEIHEPVKIRNDRIKV